MLVCFFLLTINDRNEAIIVEIKILFVLNELLPFQGVPIIRLLAIVKNGANSRL